MKNNIVGGSFFGASVYTINRSDFLPEVSKVAKEFLAQNTTDLDEIYPVKMSGGMHLDPRLSDFCQFIADSSRAILDNQGYNIDLFNMFFTGMWTQEHHKNSAMEQHTHGSGDQIIGFYFLDVPKNSSKVLFHDPNPAKVITSLPQKNIEEASQSSTIINYEAEEGMFIFSNAWLPHSFTRNRSEDPLRFIHFNLGVEPIVQPQANVEIV